MRKHSLPEMFCIGLVFFAATAIALPAQTFTNLANFNGADGNWPDLMTLVQGPDGNLYGTTFGGGANGGGTVFRVNPGGELITLYSFVGPNDGLYPNAGLVLATDGNFYGTTFASGPNRNGTVFKVTAGGSLTPLHSFAGYPTDGAASQGALVQGTDGNFYGTTRSGGANNNCSSGGGPSGCGTVFKMTPGGVLTLLYSFADSGGFYPIGALVQSTNGNFYGTTAGDGFNGSATAFKMTPAGTLNTLHSFNFYTDGSSPGGDLVQGTDGNFYGTANFGGRTGGNCGSLGCGTIFKITPGGTLTTLHTFAGYPTDGASPNDGLVQATDGNFYGTTSAGGANDPSSCAQSSPVGCGTVFKMTPGGMLTTLHSFDFTDGAYPGGLVQSTNGTFYGTTFGGGTNDNCSEGCGTVFSLSVGLGPFVETNPTSGMVGTPVIILGTSLVGATSVTFDGTPASFNVVSASEITTTVPTGATTGPVQVTTPSGTLTSNANFRVITPLQLNPVIPCRLVDTRDTHDPIQGGTSRNFTVPQLGGCGIPTTAAAYSLNVTVVPHGPLGYLTIWPAGQPQPTTSTMNSPDGRVKANAAIVPAGTNGAVSVYVANTTDVILDIDGYFTPAASGTYQFYALPPCRLVDTRGAHGNLGGPRLAAQTPRSFPLLSSTCIPSGLHPLAYSLNFTVVPNPSGQPLGYLTVWPTGESQPVSSTLNNPTATVVANAAIVPAGTGGAVDVYPDDTTDLLIDINGYFAAPGTGGLSLYAVTPCRALDTRQLGNGQPFSGTLPVDVVDSVCATSNTAQAYVFNATVVPSGSLQYLTLWPDGRNQPLVSTLNAVDGFITSNMAIVPTNDGSIDAYAAGLTQLLLDISGYFAP